MSTEVADRRRRQTLAEEVTAWEMEREDDVDEATRQIIDAVFRAQIEAKRRMRASRPQLLQAVSGEPSP